MARRRAKKRTRQLLREFGAEYRGKGYSASGAKRIAGKILGKIHRERVAKRRHR